MNKHISNESMSLLRERGVISKDEIAYYAGDLIVAENVITKARRVISEASSIISESRRVLKG